MIYNNLYNLINTYIFNNAVVGGEFTELVCVLLSAIGCVFVFAIPFLLVWKVINIFF